MLHHKLALPPIFGIKVHRAFRGRHNTDNPCTLLRIKNPEPTSKTQTIKEPVAENQLIPNTADKWQAIMVINSGPLRCPGMTGANSNNCGTDMLYCKNNTSRRSWSRREGNYLVSHLKFRQFDQFLSKGIEEENTVCLGSV